MTRPRDGSRNSKPRMPYQHMIGASKDFFNEDTWDGYVREFAGYKSRGYGALMLFMTGGLEHMWNHMKPQLDSLGICYMPQDVFVSKSHYDESTRMPRYALVKPSIKEFNMNAENLLRRSGQSKLVIALSDDAFHNGNETRTIVNALYRGWTTKNVKESIRIRKSNVRLAIVADDATSRGATLVGVGNRSDYEIQKALYGGKLPEESELLTIDEAVDLFRAKRDTTRGDVKRGGFNPQSNMQINSLAEKIAFDMRDKDIGERAIIVANEDDPQKPKTLGRRLDANGIDVHTVNLTPKLSARRVDLIRRKAEEDPVLIFFKYEVGNIGLFDSLHSRFRRSVGSVDLSLRRDACCLYTSNSIEEPDYYIWRDPPIGGSMHRHR